MGRNSDGFKNDNVLPPLRSEDVCIHMNLCNSEGQGSPSCQSIGIGKRDQKDGKT
jgi:hypothetical protein